MFDKLENLNSEERTILKILVVWGIWLILGLVVLFFFPLASEPASQGYESLNVLAWVIAAQLPFSLLLLTSALRRWRRISGDFQLVSCSVLVLTLAAVGSLVWYFSWW